MKEYCQHCKKEHDYIENPEHDGMGHTRVVKMLFHGFPIFVENSRLYSDYYDPAAQQHQMIVL